MDPISAADTSTPPPTTSTTTSPTTSTTASSLGSSGALLQPNEFMNLLIDQLKYQDPLDPTSSADFLSQLASLSQVQTEQQVAQTDETSAAAGLIGQTVSGSDASGLPVTGVVTGFEIDSGSPVLSIGSDAVALGDVTSVSASSSTTGSSSAD